MQPKAEFELRRLVLSVATFIILLSGFTICCLYFSAEESFPIRTGLIIYLICFASSNIIGFIAALQRNATLITIFAVHLLTDGVLLLIPRLLLIRFSTSLPSTICASSIFPEEGDAIEQLQNSLGDFASPAWNRGSCMVWTWSLELIAVGLILMYMGLQAVLCARLFAYASWLDAEQRNQDRICERTGLWTIDEKEEYV